MNISQDIINNIIIDYQNKEIHLDTIAEKYNITRFQIMQICDKCNVPRRRKSTKTNFSQETLDEILKDYNDMIPTRTISRKYGISLGSINRLTRKDNVDAFTLEDRLNYKAEKAIELYDQGLAVRVIAEQINMTGRDVAEAIKQSGRDIRPIAHYSQQFKVNSDYFENIDTHSKAQVLGMLWADGSVSERRKSLRLRLIYTDEQYLHHVLDDMDSDYPVHIVKRQNKINKIMRDGKEHFHISNDVAAFTIIDRKIYDDLCKLGVIPNKTYMNCIAPDIDDKFYGGWLLGLIEGDGCVQFSSRKSRNVNYATVTLLVQQNAAEKLIEFLSNKKIDAKLYPRPQFKNNLWLLCIHRIKSLIRLYHLLYDDANFVLKRKHDKFKSMLEHFSNKKKPYDIGTLRTFE